MIELLSFTGGIILGVAVFWGVYVPVHKVLEERKRKRFEEWYKANKPEPIYNEKGEKIWDPEIGVCGPAARV